MSEKNYTVKGTITLENGTLEEWEINNIPENDILMSTTFSNLLEDIAEDTEYENIIPIVKYKKKTVDSVFKYIAHLREKSETFLSTSIETYSEIIEITPEESTFNIESMELMTEMLDVADFLDIPIILESLCKRTAFNIKGKEPEEIRKIFNIEDDFTVEEKAAIQEELSVINSI